MYAFQWGFEWFDWRLDLYRDYYDGSFTQLWVGPVWFFWRD